ncbi:MAG: DUF4085 family protein [Clostridia bacterium]|nr:DUF4085 family protein [Clostridia bacterium]
MKYLTKEWYKTMQNAGFILPFRVSKKAETFSEDYFKKLYRREEKKWLDLEKEASELTFEELYPEEFPEEDYFEEVEGFPPYTEAEKEEARRQYYEEREQARIDYEEPPPFNPDKERKIFKRLFNDNVKCLKEDIPEDILKKVADIRVMALNSVSAEVKNELARYYKNNKKIVDRALKATEKEYNKLLKTDAASFIKDLSLHDCKVLSCKKDGKDVVITLDNSGGFTSVEKVRLKNCSVIKQEAKLRGAWCLYEEVYKVKTGYEIHFLLEKGKLIDYIVSVENVECSITNPEE